MKLTKRGEYSLRTVIRFGIAERRAVIVVAVEAPLPAMLSPRTASWARS